jgi:hypothetical protein
MSNHTSTRHPDPAFLDVAVQRAAAAVFLEDGLKGGSSLGVADLLLRKYPRSRDHGRQAAGSSVTR